MSEAYTVASRRAWKSEELDGLKPTVYDWVRMAAFIDGEGSVQVNPYGKRRLHQVRILVSNTNAALTNWLLRTFGGNVVLRDHKNPKWKVAYIWSCTAARAAWILWNCLPWFLMKREQAELLIELQERKDLTRQGRSLRLPEEERAYRATIHERVKVLNHKGPDGEVSE